MITEEHKDEAHSLFEVTKIQSIDASNKIEGIFTADKLLQELVLQKANPRNRSDAAIAGYREILNIIHEH